MSELPAKAVGWQRHNDPCPKCRDGLLNLAHNRGTGFYLACPACGWVEIKGPPPMTTTHDAGRRAGLLPCPFCGGTDIEHRPKHLTPRISGPGALVSYTLTHHCARAPGVVAAMVQITGREEEPAVVAWNRRAHALTPDTGRRAGLLEAARLADKIGRDGMGDYVAMRIRELAAAPTPEPEPGSTVEIDYTNHRGERGVRLIRPTGRMLPGGPQYHPEAPWVIEALDVAKNQMRAFDPAKIHRWEPQP